MLEKIINADDFGVSLGVNQAVIDGYQKGILNSTSLMVNSLYFENALEHLDNNKGLLVGLHLNLTKQFGQKCLSSPSEIPLLVNKNGYFKHGFIMLFLYSLLFSKRFKKQSALEFEAQIKKFKSIGLTLNHLDSHRHIHMIPSLFKITKKLAKRYTIPHLRIINEDLFLTLKNTKSFQCFFNGGFLKYLLLRFFSIYNHHPTQTYFYSILHTMRIKGKNIRCIKVPKTFSRVEINVHPNRIDIDKENYHPSFEDYLLFSKSRFEEYKTILDKDLLNRIYKN